METRLRFFIFPRCHRNTSCIFSTSKLNHCQKTLITPNFAFLYFNNPCWESWDLSSHIVTVRTKTLVKGDLGNVITFFLIFLLWGVCAWVILCQDYQFICNYISNLSVDAMPFNPTDKQINLFREIFKWFLSATAIDKKTSNMFPEIALIC